MLCLWRWSQQRWIFLFWWSSGDEHDADISWLFSKYKYATLHLSMTWRVTIYQILLEVFINALLHILPPARRWHLSSFTVKMKIMARQACLIYITRDVIYHISIISLWRHETYYHCLLQQFYRAVAWKMHSMIIIPRIVLYVGVA